MDVDAEHAAAVLPGLLDLVSDPLALRGLASTRTTRQLLPLILLSIHARIAASPDRLISSHRFGVAKVLPSKDRMFRTCWVRQKSFAKWKL